VPELQRLRADHAPAVLAFELANRAYFAASISDRGDEFFDQFTERYSALLAEQEAGIGAFYVLVAEDGSVLGQGYPQSSFGWSWRLTAGCLRLRRSASWPDAYLSVRLAAAIPV